MEVSVTHAFVNIVNGLILRNWKQLGLTTWAHNFFGVYAVWLFLCC
jgi:hypothetical protein